MLSDFYEDSDTVPVIIAVMKDRTAARQEKKKKKKKTGRGWYKLTTRPKNGFVDS